MRRRACPASSDGTRCAPAACTRAACMPERWRVALIDSGADAVARIETSARFVETAAGFSTLPLAADASGHGTRVASIIASAQPPPGLVVAQVFEQRRGTTAAAVAAAIHWALAARADLIHMS